MELATRHSDPSNAGSHETVRATDGSNEAHAASLLRTERQLFTTIESFDALDEIFAAVVAAIGSIDEVASTAIFRREEGDGAFLLQAESGMDPAALPILRRIPAAPHLPDAFLRGERSRVTSLRALFSELFPRGYSGPSRDEILDAAVIVVALEHSGSVIGGVNVRLHPGCTVREDLLLFLDSLGAWLAGAIHRRSVEAELRRAMEQLSRQEAALNAANAALRMLVEATRDQAEADRRRMRENVLRVVKPFLVRVKAESSNRELARAADLLELNLASLSRPMTPDVTDGDEVLTPREERIATMVRDGMSGKEIAVELGISVHAVAFHRRNIRRKIGITGKRANLASVLRRR
jgi:DNA-binding CsgD family transcriptional regulator/outer membrane murein-binding lipoprotein Lpp